MEALKKGSVVLIRFPFSDLTHYKLRPAIVLAPAEKGDFILCQVTSKPYDSLALEITASDFQVGSLHRTSYARPSKLFTANDSIILKEVGLLQPAAASALIGKVIEILK
ncbi:MAG: type II toxin-antitoxin system PemK/MazF family toxin [Alteromonadaceae bacterium]|nr:type II toxin-antitoxin system PemK/MazF family toxin [Alteromonadaceae bacterium]